MYKVIFFFILAVVGLSSCQNKSPENSAEIKLLKQLLFEKPDSISTLKNKLSKDESELAIQLVHDYRTSELTKQFQVQWENETLELGEDQLKFKYKKFGEKPPEGWSLYISMHGGGGAPAELNDRQWQNQQKLYEPAEGIYMAPRAPTDSWNMWHRPHIDEFFGLFIQLADAYEDINTNRVYITGYSAGGDGTFRLAPRMADWFAAGAMMAGHPGDVSPLSLRNLPFTIHMGGEDAAYHRNEIAAKWKVKLDELQENDPEGYVHDVQIHEGMPHWMQQKDTVAIEWMAQYNRNPYPEKVVWKQDGVTHDRFYWLGVPEGEAQKKAEVVASINAQNIQIEKAENVNNLLIKLNDKMLDLDKKVSVEFNGEVIYNAVPKRTLSVIWKSLNEHNDLEQVFTAEIAVALD
jgi:poly(3-hydroxybutyrate) depolymerase